MSFYLFPSLRSAILNQGASSGKVIISGDLSTDLTLTAIFESQGDIYQNSISYNWYDASNDSIIKQKSQTYTVVPSDVGKSIYATATFIKTVGTTTTVKSKPLLVESYDYAPTGGVSIGSTLYIGYTYGITNTIQDKNGIPAGGFSYAWYRDDGTFLNSTNSTYTPTLSDKDFGIYVIVSYTDLFGYNHSIQSNISNPVKNINYGGTANLSITGITTNGYTLTANVSNLSDQNGLPTNPVIEYRWLRYRCGSYCRYSVLVNYSTSATTYTLTGNDVNTRIVFEIRYTDNEGYSNTIRSGFSSYIKDVNRSPGGSLSVTGTQTVGETLQVTDNVTDANGMPSYSSRTYTWYHYDTNNQIYSGTGTSGRSYTLQESDKGKQIRIKLSYTDNHGYSNEFWSSIIGPIAAKDYAPTGTITISGTTTEGQTLIASDNIADLNGISTGAITYNWYRSGSSTSIATGSSYTLVSSDIGKTLYVVASYTDNDGFSHSITSSNTSTVQEYNEPATGQIVIENATEEGSTLRVVIDTISDPDGIDSSTKVYNWYRGNTYVSSGTTYTLTSADTYNYMKLVYSFSDNKGQSYTFTSNEVGPIQPLDVGANPYQIEVKTDNAGTSSDNQFTIPATGNYVIDWGDGNKERASGTKTHTYATAGTYNIKVSEGLTRIHFNGGGDKGKLQKIVSWGSIQWSSFEDAYNDCGSLNITATDSPDLFNVTSMKRAFAFCYNLSGNSYMNNWDVSRVQNLEMTFWGCALNIDLRDWRVGSATTMEQMFYNCFYLDQKAAFEFWGAYLRPDVNGLYMFTGTPMQYDPPSWWDSWTQNIAT